MCTEHARLSLAWPPPPQNIQCRGNLNASPAAKHVHRVDSEDLYLCAPFVLSFLKFLSQDALKPPPSIGRRPAPDHFYPSFAASTWQQSQ